MDLIPYSQVVNVVKNLNSEIKHKWNSDFNKNRHLY